MSGECDLCGDFGHAERFCPTVQKEKPHEWDCEKDDEAWRKIVAFAQANQWAEANEVFLTRCAESAQEALSKDEAKSKALEAKLKRLAGNVLSYLRMQQRTTTSPDLAKYEKQIREALAALNEGKS